MSRRRDHFGGRPARRPTGSNGASTAHCSSVRSNRPVTGIVCNEVSGVREFLVENPSTGDLTVSHHQHTTEINS